MYKLYNMYLQGILQSYTSNECIHWRDQKEAIEWCSSVLDHAFDYAQVEYCAIEYCFFNTKKLCNSAEGYLAFFSISSCHKVCQRHTAK